MEKCEKRFRAMLGFLNARPRLKRAVVLFSRLSTYLMYAAYPSFLVYLYLKTRELPVAELLVPAISFVALSVIRALLNFPRPYERFSITPLYNKETKGKSFPSRHTFSAFIISFTILSRFPALGLGLCLISALLGACRVLSGVHFIRDILAAFTFAALSGAFYLI